MKQILLTNDDGIASPGLWAAAEALSRIGYVHVVAPRLQSTGAGRSVPSSFDCVIEEQEVIVKQKPWKVYSVNGTPAQAVQHAILEILPQPLDLIVSGINYGENIGSSVTLSGTIGAALEGSTWEIPALAVSLETDEEHHYSHSTDVKFEVAGYFTALFGAMLLEKRLPFDVDLLKVEVPADATVETPWVVTRQSRRRYYDLFAPERRSWTEPAKANYRRGVNHHTDGTDTDAYVVNVLRQVAVTPLSYDLTSRVDLKDLDGLMRE